MEKLGKIIFVILLLIMFISLNGMLWDIDVLNIDKFWEKVIGTDFLLFILLLILFVIFNKDDDDDDCEKYPDGKIMI